MWNLCGLVVSGCMGTAGVAGEVRSDVIPMVRSHVSTNSGHLVIGCSVRRSPNACPPSAYKCISTGTPAFFSAMK